MNFWDTSALLPIFVPEATSSVMHQLYGKLEQKTVWTLTSVEAITAISRLERSHQLSPHEYETTREKLMALFQTCYLIDDIEGVKERAYKIVNFHPLKSADAIQLAAALVACLDNPWGHYFVTLDQQLADSALKEGFRILPASS